MSTEYQHQCNFTFKNGTAEWLQAKDVILFHLTLHQAITAQDDLLPNPLFLPCRVLPSVPAPPLEAQGVTEETACVRRPASVLTWRVTFSLTHGIPSEMQKVETKVRATRDVLGLKRLQVGRKLLSL